MLKGSDESSGFWRPKRQQVVERNAELLFRVSAKVLLDEVRSETVKAGCYCRMSREEIAGSSCRQRHLEGLSRFFHEAAGALQHRERRVAFIQMTDFRLESERAKQAPSADSEQQLLLEAQLRAAAIELAGDPTMSGKIRGVITVQQVKLHAADLNLPGAQPDRIPGQGDL